MAEEKNVSGSGISSLVSSTGSSIATIQFALTGHAPAIRAYHAPPLDNEIYALVGRVAAEWGRLEHSLDVIIAELIPLPSPRLACLTAQMMGIWPRYNAIIALLTQNSTRVPKYSECLKTVQSIAGQSRDVSERRNRIVHDPWYVDGYGVHAQFKSMPRAELIYGIKDVDRKEIEATLVAIAKLDKRVSEFRVELQFLKQQPSP